MGYVKLHAAYNAISLFEKLQLPARFLRIRASLRQSSRACMNLRESVQARANLRICLRLGESLQVCSNVCEFARVYPHLSEFTCICG